MPLSPSERTSIVNELKNRIGNYQNTVNVTYNGYGFSASQTLFNWFTSLPFAYQEGILSLVGDRQGSYDSTTKQWIQEEPYNYWGDAVSWGQYMKDILNKDWGQLRNVFGKTAEAVFNNLEAQKWERYTSANEEVGLWNYAKTQRWSGGTEAAFHNWLKDLLPELFCDYVNSIEPQPDLSVSPIFETTQPDVYILSIGIWNEGTKSIVMISKTDPTQDVWAVLKTKMAKRQNRLLIPSALYANSSKTKSKIQQTIESGTAGAVQYDLNTYKWKIINPTVPRYSVSEVINYIPEAAAITVLNTFP